MERFLHMCELSSSILAIIPLIASNRKSSEERYQSVRALYKNTIEFY